jgi:Uma2 family endonuclease
MVIGEKTLYTTEEFETFEKLPENQERLFELIYGEIREKIITEAQGLIAGIIPMLFLQYAEARKLGYPTVETSHKLPKDKHNARRPDVSFRRANSPIVTEGAVPRMPDLAVEIQSLDDSPRELREKAAYYLQNGSEIVWLVYPKTKSIEVCTLTEAGTMAIVPVTLEGKLTEGAVLPGIELSVKDIFERPIWQQASAK